MKLIQPCCAERNLRELRDALKDGGRSDIEGFGDLALTELLPAILTRYYETDMLIAAPSVPDQAAEATRILNLLCKYSGRITAEMLDKNTYNVETGEWKQVADEWARLEAEALR